MLVTILAQIGQLEAAEFSDQIPFVVLTTAVCVHVPCSVGNHLFLPISVKVSSLWRKLDVGAIFVACALQTFAFTYFVLSTNGTRVLTAMSATVCILALRAVRKENYEAGEVNRRLNTVGVGFAALFYLFPIFYQMVLTNGGCVPLMASFGVLLSLGLGGLIFAISWPEKNSERMYDIVGQSQQLMHGTLVIAHVFEMLFILDSFYRMRGLQPVC